MAKGTGAVEQGDWESRDGRRSEDGRRKGRGQNSAKVGYGSGMFGLRKKGEVAAEWASVRDGLRCNRVDPLVAA